MALDLGTLTAYVEVDDRKGQQTLMGMQQKLRQFASQTQPDVKIGADGSLVQRAVEVARQALLSIPDEQLVITADSTLAERALIAMATHVRGLPDGELQVTADVSSARSALDRLGSERQTAEVVATANTADAQDALSELADTDLSSEIEVDADVGAARAAITGLTALASVVRMGVLADPSQAIAVLAGLRAAGRSTRVEVPVEADTSAAEEEITGLGGSGKKAGRDAGDGLGKGILAALVALPLAGSVVAIGAAIGKSMVSGLQNEVRGDLLAARTGLDEVTVAKIGRAAGEAYAGNFGESIASNMDTARAAIQVGLLDPAATARDSQAVIEQLSGVADILGEDIPAVARAAGVLLKNGLAKDAAAAFDVLVKGQQSGANAGQDLLDTFTEYPAVLARLGLSATDSLGLLSQGLQAGARDSDFVADALKEFQIRATDASETSAAGFQAIGLNAEEMTRKISAGGAGAREGLQQVLDGLRGIEDPVARNVAAVALFGTKAEDLGASLYALDLNTVAAQLGTVEGAANGAVSALGDNAAGQIESARRNIEVAADGIKGALAAAFGDQISTWAQGVQENRAGVVQFLLDMANGAFDAGRALVEAAAAGTEGFGSFISDTGPGVIDTLLGIINALDYIPGIDFGDAVEGLESARATLERIGPQSEAAGEALRTGLIENGIDPAQRALNEVGIDQVTQARFHDATVALANDIADVGYKADGSRMQIQAHTGALDLNTAAGQAMDAQLRTAVQSLGAQLNAAAAAGEGTDSLTGTFNANRESLIQQIQQLGFSREAAQRLAEQYGAVPGLVQTAVTQPGMPQAQGGVRELDGYYRNLPGQVVTNVQARTYDAAVAVANYQRQLGNIPRTISTTVFVSEIRRDAAAAARGGVQPRRAGGGWLRGPGTATSDSIPWWGSNGEFIVNARAAAQNAALLEAINAGRSMSSAATALVTPGPVAAAVPAGNKSVTVHVTNNFPKPDTPGNTVNQNLRRLAALGVV